MRPHVLPLLASGVLALGLMRPAQAQAPISMPRISTDIKVEEDGSTDTVIAVELRIGSDAVARSQGQQSMPYSPALETMEVTSAETRKADGRVLKVDLAGIQERLLPAAAGASDFDDRRARIVVFPDVATGDTLALSVHRHSLRVLFPGQFTLRSFVPSAFPVRYFEVNIDAPKTMILNTDTSNVRADHYDLEGRMHWHFVADGVGADVAAHAVATEDLARHVFVSSFRGWPQYAEASHALMAPKVEVTPEIQAKADEIVAGVTDRREQAHRLYDWVSTHIRYVNVLLGIGGFEPHAAGIVLAHGYGDCKDHVVLFDSLLAARGIGSEMALISLGNAYRVPEVTAVPTFNHVITYLPEFDLYADSTATTAPFGTLAWSEYGKTVLHLGSAGAAMRQVPVLAPDAAVEDMRTTMSMLADGAIEGTTVTTGSGPFGGTLRGFALRAQADSTAGTKRLKENGFSGTATVVRSRPEVLSPSTTLASSFKLDKRPEYLDGTAFSLPTGLRIIARPGDFLLGDLYDKRIAAGEPVPCWSGRQAEQISLALPEGRRIEKLPRGLNLEAEGVTYSSTWTLEGGVVTVRRELVAKVEKALCDGAVRVAQSVVLEKVRADLGRQVTIAEE